MAEKVGVFNRLGFCTSGGSTATSEFEFLEGSTLGLTEQYIDANALRGSRFHSSERVRQGTRRVDGVINMAPNSAELAILLPYILGGVVSGNTYPMGERLTDFVLFGVRDGVVYTYPGLKVERATFSCQAGGPMQLSMTVVGVDETQSGSMGAAAIDLTTGGPYVLMDSVVSIAATTLGVEGFDLTIDNHLEVKYRNSITPSTINATDSTVSISLPLSFGINSAFYNSALGGVSVVNTLTNGNCSLAFSLAAAQSPRAPLPFGQRGVMDFPWQAVCRKASTTLPLITVLDSTP